MPLEAQVLPGDEVHLHHQWAERASGNRFAQKALIVAPLAGRGDRGGHTLIPDLPESGRQRPCGQRRPPAEGGKPGRLCRARPRSGRRGHGAVIAEVGHRMAASAGRAVRAVMALEMHTDGRQDLVSLADLVS